MSAQNQDAVISASDAAQSVELPDPDSDLALALDAARTEAGAAAHATAHASALAVAELCQLAGHPERTAAFLAQGTSQAEVRRTLLTARATSVEIASLIAPDAAASRSTQALDTTYRAFLLDAHGVNNADVLDIVARCIVGHTTPGMRTPPHYHHTCDHVLCLYLDCGQDRPSRDTLTREKGDGELVLQDPRPMAGFPFWEKTKYIYTTPGMAVLHPSRVWHETNPFVGTGHRSLLAVTLRVASHNYGDLYVNL